MERRASGESHGRLLLTVDGSDARTHYAEVGEFVDAVDRDLGVVVIVGRRRAALTGPLSPPSRVGVPFTVRRRMAVLIRARVPQPG